MTALSKQQTILELKEASMRPVTAVIGHLLGRQVPERKSELLLSANQRLCSLGSLAALMRR